MKHSGKLPNAVTGEIQHEINTSLSAIIFRANIMGGKEAIEIELLAFKIANYVKSLGEKTEWNSNPFENTGSTASTMMDRKAA